MKKNLLLTTAICLLTSYIAFGQYTKLLDFSGVANGNSPQASFIYDGTFLYGTTAGGGIDAYGTLFKIRPDGTGYSKLLDFAGAANGTTPYCTLLYDGTFLYGTTVVGGTNNDGTIFKINPDGTGYSKLLDFAGASNGSFAFGSLISDGTFLYGMTRSGGANNMGTLFKIMTDGTGYIDLLDFAGATNGSTPYGSLISDGTFLYGMTSLGGINDSGVVFKIKPDGTGYSKLLDFGGAGNGSLPRGTLYSDGTMLYGMTIYGGTHNDGIIFKIKPDGTGYSKLLDFAGTSNGGKTFGSLISDGTFLYGVTSVGGTNNDGTIFKIKPDGTGYSKLLDFAGAVNGSNPYGSLISDGTFLYGMTFSGGTYNEGTVFKYALATGITENNAENDFTVYPNPTSGVFTVFAPSLKGENNNIEIYNLLGEKVYSEKILNPKSQILNIDVPNGIYFLHLTTEQGAAVKKIIINK